MTLLAAKPLIVPLPEPMGSVISEIPSFIQFIGCDVAGTKEIKAPGSPNGQSLTIYKESKQKAINEDGKDPARQEDVGKADLFIDGEEGRCGH